MYSPERSYSQRPLQHPSVAQKYMEEQIKTMSPIQLLVKLYDLAIEACNRQDRRKASQAIVEMISALNFDYQEIADRFFHIYKFCMHQVKAGQFEEAKTMLQDLRDAWVDASRMNASSADAPTPMQSALVTQA